MADDITIGVRVVNGDELARALAADSVAVAAFTSSAVSKYGRLLQTAVKAAASGRPGPRAQTGDYRRSITLAIQAAAGSASAVVGTNSPQAARLEFGFAPGIGPQNGVDVLGRHFHQPPYPHFGPAFDRIAPLYEAYMERGIDAIVAGGSA